MVVKCLTQMLYSPRLKTNVKDLAAELNLSVDDLLKLASEKLTGGVTGKGKNTWYSAEATDILRLAKDAPMAVADKLKGLVIAPCRNPTWVYVKIDGIDGKRLVHISRRYTGMLIGKRIAIEAITDISGTTYRHDTTAPRSDS